MNLDKYNLIIQISFYGICWGKKNPDVTIRVYKNWSLGSSFSGPSVTVDVNYVTVCEGENVVFTATPSVSGGPTHGRRVGYVEMLLSDQVVLEVPNVFTKDGYDVNISLY